MANVGVDINVRASGGEQLERLKDLIGGLGTSFSDIQKTVSSKGGIPSQGSNSGSLSQPGGGDPNPDLYQGLLQMGGSLSEITDILKEILGVETDAVKGDPTKLPGGLSDPKGGGFLDGAKGVLGGKGSPFEGLAKATTKLGLVTAGIGVAVELAGAGLAAYNERIKTSGNTINSLGSGGSVASAAQAQVKSHSYFQFIESEALNTFLVGIPKLAVSIAEAMIGTEKAKSREEAWSSYKQYIPEILETKGRIGGYESSEEIFNQSSIANIYGYSSSTGLEVMKGLAGYGVNSFRPYSYKDDNDIKHGSSEAMYMGRQFGVNPSENIPLLGQAGRYGKNENKDENSNVLRYVAGSLKTQGLDRGMFSEMRDSFEKVFSSSLKSGVVQSFSDIGSTLNFFSKGGETWKGGLGADKLLGMNSVMAGAVNLTSDKDAFLFQSLQEKGEGYWDVAKKLEKGMTEENIGSIAKRLDSESGGNLDDMRHKVMSTFGLSATDTITFTDMLKNGLKSGNFGTASKEFEILSETSEEKTMAVLERISHAAAECASILTTTVGLSAMGGLDSMGGFQAIALARDVLESDTKIADGVHDYQLSGDGFSLVDIAILRNAAKYMGQDQKGRYKTAYEKAINPNPDPKVNDSGGSNISSSEVAVLIGIIAEGTAIAIKNAAIVIEEP